MSHESIVSDTEHAKARLVQNVRRDFVTGFGDDMDNWLVNSGINDPNKAPGDPYYGASDTGEEDGANAIAPDAASVTTVTRKSFCNSQACQAFALI